MGLGKSTVEAFKAKYNRPFVPKLWHFTEEGVFFTDVYGDLVHSDDRAGMPDYVVRAWYNHLTALRGARQRMANPTMVIPKDHALSSLRMTPEELAGVYHARTLMELKVDNWPDNPCFSKLFANEIEKGWLKQWGV